MDRYICFDIGGTKIKYGVLEGNGNILVKDSVYTPKKNLDEFLGTMEKIINDYMNEYEIKGVSISVPGFINPDKGTVEVCQGMPILEGLNFKTIFGEKFNVPVEVENDANCVVLAEKFNGNGQKSNSFIVVTVGTGIGGGIFVDGKLIRGHEFKAGEFGFMLTNGVDNVPEEFQLYSDNASTNGLIRYYKNLKNIDKSARIEGQLIFEEGKGDEEVNKIIEQWFKNISYGILNLCSIINPEKILIGGAISERQGFIEKIEETLDHIKWWSYVKTPIERCYHKNDGGLVGALFHWLMINGK